MQRAVGARTRFEIVYRLTHGGDLRPAPLDELMDIDDSTLHYLLNKLVNVGIVEKRKRSDRDDNGLSTYYRVTALGEVTLTQGVEALLHREWDFLTAYNSSNDG